MVTMKHLVMTQVIVCMVFPPSWACGPRATNDATVPSTNPAVTDEGPQIQADANQLLGLWELQRDPDTGSGIRLAVRVDSAAGTSFHGALDYLMVGDLGIDPRLYAPTEGEITPAGSVRLSIVSQRPSDTGIEILGTLRRDTINVATFMWNGESQMTEGQQVMLLRVRREK